MKHPLQEMMDKRRQGIRCGIPSYCSANELVLEIALRRAKERNTPVLIEATANQVNQFGGYTGMVPKDFYQMVLKMAQAIDLPENMIILAGDHLGPLTWQNLPEEKAMENSRESIFQALDLSYFPLEIVTLIFNDITKDALNEIDDFIKYNENNGVSIRNTFLSKLVLQQVRHNKLLELIKEILIHISPQVTENLHTYWNEIEATLMKEKLLRKRLGLKTSSIKNMLFEIQSYYNDNYNYWIQVGISEQMDNEFEKALNHFQQAEALNPNSYMVKNAIARNFLKQANSCKIIGSAKPYFEEGERRMLELIKEREEFQVKAYSTHCYLYEKINYFENFNIVPNDDDLKKMYDLLETIIEKTPEDGMSKHISNKFFNFLKKINKTYILNIKFYDLSVLKLMFEKYDIDTDIFEDFEIDG